MSRVGEEEAQRDVRGWDDGRDAEEGCAPAASELRNQARVSADRTQVAAGCAKESNYFF